MWCCYWLWWPLVRMDGKLAQRGVATFTWYSGWSAVSCLLCGFVWHCLHSMPHWVYEAAECLSVCPVIWPLHAAVAGLLLSSGREISIDCCTAGAQQQMRPGSRCQLTVGCWTQNAASPVCSVWVLVCVLMVLQSSRIAATAQQSSDRLIHSLVWCWTELHGG